MNIYQKRLADIEQNISELEKEKEQALIDLNEFERKYCDKLKSKNDIVMQMIEKDLHIVSSEFIKPQLVTKDGDFVQYIPVPEFMEITKEQFMSKTTKRIYQLN